MKIDIVPVGLLKDNCYILTKDDKVIVIDPGDEYEKIYPYIKNKEILKVLVTHYHFDHVGALTKFDVNQILPRETPKEYTIGPFNFEVIETKGHTEDSLTYYFKEENCMFTGDFLFKGSIGRTDFPTGNPEKMKQSLNKIIKYRDDITVYPGHGEKTTIGHEKRTNPFITL